MLVSPTGLASATEPLDEPRQPAPQPHRGAPVHTSSTDVLISTQQVLFSTAAAVRVRRENTGRGLVGIVRRMFATSTPAARPHSRHYPKRYGYLENAAMTRAMERL